MVRCTKKTSARKVPHPNTIPTLDNLTSQFPWALSTLQYYFYIKSK
jgi:hypothetical protein